MYRKLSFLFGFIFLTFLSVTAFTRIFSNPSFSRHAMTPTCSSLGQDVQSALRVWVDATDRAPGWALPPGSIPPGATSAPTTSHILNVELQLTNSSEQTQSVQVVDAEWDQGVELVPFLWERQPDMSPLNRFNTIQRLPLDLKPGAQLRVELRLLVNGKSCLLTASKDVPAVN